MGPSDERRVLVWRVADVRDALGLWEAGVTWQQFKDWVRKVIEKIAKGESGRVAVPA